MSEKLTVAKHLPDGQLWKKRADGTEEVVDVAPVTSDMTDDEIATAARSDPDAVPMTAEEWDRAPKTPRAKVIRQALRLTQEEFASRYRIAIGTLRDWEQGRAEPDQTARAYLQAIAGDAEGVYRALNGHRAAAE